MRWFRRALQLVKYYVVSGVLLFSSLTSALPGLAQKLPVADSVKQALPEKFILGAYAQGAIIINHTRPVSHLVASHPTGFELNVQRQTTGAAPWHSWYKYPKVGLALVYYDYHNPILGQSYAASVYLSKAIRRTARHDLSFRLGTGLAYFPQHYDLYTNRKNTFVSSALNATLQMRLEYDVALSQHLGLLMGLGLNHYSNGGSAKPNFGINLPTLLLGLNYYQQRPVPTPTTMAPDPTDIGRTFFNISASLGYKQRTGGDPRHYPVSSVTLAVGRRVNRKSNLLLGIEGFDDRSLAAVLRDTARSQDHLPDVKKASAFVGHELLFGRLAMVTHLGFYVYNPYKSNPFYYERIGLKYQLTNLLFVDVDLKAHRATADVIELKLGVKL
ncbi:acyloxyacyl hydrolase [Hymenobacter sp. BRD67]|uniref:acyloxyacyl hydrolase n=1 Tax=Hymenobacter sp. BRD67 TaxID=2675877 RepID=UPI0015650587|nr:acyloxyacyl hydrolase [Hymenobacter sp. BRD67]QKG53226.1 acyloxyacyl hydrolase [Hymenobacter sp. BRD67]